MPLLLSVIFEPLMVAIRWLGVTGGAMVVGSLISSLALRVGVFVGSILFIQGVLAIIEPLISGGFSAVGVAFSPILVGLQYSGVIHALNIFMSFGYYRLVIKTSLYQGITAPVGGGAAGSWGAMGK